MANVLVTGAGGAGGIGAIRALQAETNHRIVSVDMDAEAPGLYLADDGRTVPSASDADWPESVRDVVHTFDVDVVIPTVDEELTNLPRLTAVLPDEVETIAPTDAVIATTLDKYRLCTTLASEGHTVPTFWLGTESADVDPSDFPVLIKPRRGRGSRGVRRIDAPEDLETRLEASDYPREDLLIQEFIAGTEYTTSVVVTKDNRLLEVVPKEAIEKQGSTVRGATRTNAAVANSCRELFHTLQPAGPLNVQQIVDERGDPYTIEINPRFSSTSCLTVAAGVNELDLLIRDALGESVSHSGGFEEGLQFFRYPDHLFVPQDETEPV